SRVGQISSLLLKAFDPIRYDLACLAGQKVLWVLMYLPIGIGLSLAFHPSLHPSVAGVLIFLVAIWGAYLIRSMFLWILGMFTFWTTRGSAIFETYILCELLLSGRLLPLPLMPHWTQTLAAWLPFKWTFYFPIETLVWHMSTASLLGGLAMQLRWTAIGRAIRAARWS